jgi:hypothetical protein
MPPKVASTTIRGGKPTDRQQTLMAKRTLEVLGESLSDEDSSQDASIRSNKRQKTPVTRGGGGDVVSEDDGPDLPQQPAATAPPRIRIRLNACRYCLISSLTP